MIISNYINASSLRRRGVYCLLMETFHLECDNMALLTLFNIGYVVRICFFFIYLHHVCDINCLFNKLKERI